VSAVVVTEAELRSPRVASVMNAARRDGILLFGSPPGLLQNVQARSSGGAETP
jgi:hypothetical protein